MLAVAEVQELVLDLRYNPGGYLYVARALASMVTGPANDSRVFERLAFNGKPRGPGGRRAALDVDVVIVGGTTCGKPYGLRRRDNCELSLYPIEFQGFNAKDYGDFSVGFAPTCPGADDFSTALGNPAEGLLGIALRPIDIGACTASAALPRSAPLMALDTRRPAHAGRVLINKPARP